MNVLVIEIWVIKTSKNSFFITTAIDYPSAKPHIGHLYEKICADVIARWNRLKKKKVHFSTGLDEHGSKIQKYADTASKPPRVFVDDMAQYFIELCKKFNISYDDFVRTTEKRHEKVVNKIFMKLYENGDIYKDKYEGFYCIDCETFYLPKDLVNGKCSIHGKDVEIVKEESYFFKMSKYQERLIEHIKNNPEFIRPKGRRNEILNRLKEPLKDLSISRLNVKWGIPLPIDKTHVQYVWLDALNNYLTTIDYPNAKFEEFWPALHIVGKDIVWHHTVIWGSFLLSLGLELPSVFVHGFITTDGRKMSKSLGNIIDPMKLASKYPTDAIRYFLIREIPFGEDGDFTEKALIERINGELVADLGNLIYRVLSLAEKFDGSFVGKDEISSKLNLKKIDVHMERLELTAALGEIWNFTHLANKYINDNEPWKLKGKELGNVLYNLLEVCRIISILIYPFMPETAEKINVQLGTKLGSLKDCKFRKFEGKIKKGSYLFNKIEV